MELLLNCYPNQKANDPEIYVGALASILTEFPYEVAAYVTDPRTGLPRNNKFLPSVAELLEACKERLTELAANNLQQQQHPKQSES